MCNQRITSKYPCYALLQLIKQPTFKKSFETQTSLLGLIGYSFESCERKIYKLIKKHSSNLPEIKEKIEEEFGEIDLQHKFIFIQALVSAVCRSCLNSNIGFDESKFKSLCSLLSMYIDGNQLFELVAFIAIKLLQHKLEYQTGKKFFECICFTLDYLNYFFLI